VIEEEEVLTTQEIENIPQEERVTIRLKFLNETQRDVEASLMENIGQFKRRNFTEEIASQKNVRLIFNGQMLRDENKSLADCGLVDKCVVHCLIHNNNNPDTQQQQQQQGVQQTAQQPTTGPQQELDVSVLLIPLLGLSLALLWYCAIVHSSYFNLMSTTALLGLTSLYFLSIYGTHFHVNVAVRTGGHTRHN